MPRMMISKISKIVSILEHIFHTKNINNLLPANVLLTCHDNDRAVEVEGKKYSQILDTLNEKFTDNGISTITIATLFSRYYGKSAFGNVYNIHGMMIRSMLARKIHKLLFNKIDDDKDQVIKTWLKVLLHIKPRCILGIQPPRELCVAAQKLGIWIADVQHGILSDEGYYGIKNRSYYDSPGWPNAILAWDEESASWLNKESSGYVKGYVVGNPWVLRFTRQKKSDIVLNKILCSTNLNSYETPILVTLAWNLERYGSYPKIGIPKALISVIKQSNLKCTWWIRIHPVQLNDPKYSFVENSLRAEFGSCPNVIWNECTQCPLPLVLSQAKLHITVLSAVTVEAEWFNVKTALLYEDAALLRKYFGPQIARGSAQIVNPSKKSIISWIEESMTTLHASQPRNLPTSHEALSHLLQQIKDFCLNSSRDWQKIK